MNKVLFRGNRLRGGGWIYGDYIHRRIWDKEIAIIRTFDSGFDNYDDYKVDPATVSQYIGLTDKLKKKIFEGDFIQGKDGIFLIEYEETIASFIVKGPLHARWRPGLNYGSMLSYTVIGDRWNNPELLEGIDDA